MDLRALDLEALEGSFRSVARAELEPLDDELTTPVPLDPGQADLEGAEPAAQRRRRANEEGVQGVLARSVEAERRGGEQGEGGGRSQRPTPGPAPRRRGLLALS